MDSLQALKKQLLKRNNAHQYYTKSLAKTFQAIAFKGLSHIPLAHSHLGLLIQQTLTNLTFDEYKAATLKIYTIYIHFLISKFVPLGPGLHFAQKGLAQNFSQQKLSFNTTARLQKQILYMLKKKRL